MTEEVKQPVEETTPPTKEEIIAFLSENIEVTKLRAELQDLNTRIASGRAEELKALMFISQVTNPKQQETQQHIITEEDMTANPELKDAGVKVGDEVTIPAQPARKLKKD